MICNNVQSIILLNVWDRYPVSPPEIKIRIMTLDSFVCYPKKCLLLSFLDNRFRRRNRAVFHIKVDKSRMTKKEEEIFFWITFCDA